MQPGALSGRDKILDDVIVISIGQHFSIFKQDLFISAGRIISEILVVICMSGRIHLGLRVDTR
jgi:hypothetical protein